MIYVPGKLFSVAPYTVRRVPYLFARNERVVCLFDTQVGTVAQVLVGAMLVGSMSTVWAGDILRGHTRQTEVTHYSAADITLDRGAEMGRFNMGSTVILILPPGAVTRTEHLPMASPVRLGQRIATLVPGVPAEHSAS